MTAKAAMSQASKTLLTKSASAKRVAEMSKIGEMYSSAARDAYKPVERAMEKHRA